MGEIIGGRRLPSRCSCSRWSAAPGKVKGETGSKEGVLENILAQEWEEGGKVGQMDCGGEWGVEG